MIRRLLVLTCVLGLAVGCGGNKKSYHASTTAPASSGTTTPVTSGSTTPVTSSTTTPGLPPVAAIQPPTTSPARGNIALSHTITDVDSDPADVVFEYSVDDGATWAAASDAGPSEGSEGTSALTTTPTGAAHTFVWSSRQDVGDALLHFVKVRVTPSDVNGQGTTAGTAVFVVDNTEQATRLANLIIPVDPEGPDSLTQYGVSLAGGLSVTQASQSTGGQGRQMSSNSGLAMAGGMVFAAHNRSSSIEAFLVDSNGDLTPHPAGPTSTSANPTVLAVTPNGKFLYTSTGNYVEGFAVSAAGLTPVPGSPFNVGTSPRDLVVHPRGDVLFTGHMFGADLGVRVHQIDPATGALTFSSALDLTATGSRPGKHLCITPDGTRLFCSDLDNGVFVIDVDPTTSALSLATGAPFSVGAFLTGMTTTTRGDYVYVTTNGPSLLGYAVDASGRLSAVPGAPFANVGSSSLYLETDGADRLLFISSRTDDTLRVYSIDPNYGMLTEMPGSPVHNGNGAGAVGPLLPLSTVSATQSTGPTVLLSEDFSSGLGQWTNATGDDFDWTRHTGSTTSFNTGPTGDHTTGSGYYVYTESSSPNYPNKVAILQSPAFANHTNLQLSFWYHMLGDPANGRPMGELHVDVSTDGGSSWTPDAWQRSGTQGSSWNQATVDLSGYAGQTVVVRFRVVTVSYCTDVALDDIQVTD